MKSNNDIVSNLDRVKPKDKAPRNRSVLDSWISRIESEIDPARSGHLAWLVASTVIAAKLQSVIDADGKSRFLLKGGTLLQHKLGLAARATGDIDGIINGDIDNFINLLDAELQINWGTLAFSRTEIETINTPAKIIKPRRFEIVLSIRGQTWRRVVVEISPDEGRAGSTQEVFRAPNLAPLGLPSPDYLVGMAMSYQIAQKIHGATDPHNPPEYVNYRARDVVDLVLIKSLIEADGTPSNSEIESAVNDIFTARANEAKVLARTPRYLPTKVVPYPHWEEDFAEAAKSCNLSISLSEATEIVNAWINEIAGSD